LRKRKTAKILVAKRGGGGRTHRKCEIM